MMNVKANMCSCCQEIWNQINLNEVSLGEHSLYLCPDCFKELKKMVDSKEHVEDVESCTEHKMEQIAKSIGVELGEEVMLIIGASKESIKCRILEDRDV